MKVRTNSSPCATLEMFGEYTLAHLIVLCSLAVSVVLLCLYKCFGTVSLPSIIQQYRTNKKFDDKYNLLFSRREALAYHISWARSRGDAEQDMVLTNDLIKLDKEIDEFEQSIDIKRLSTSRRGKKSS